MTAVDRNATATAETEPVAEARPRWRTVLSRLSTVLAVTVVLSAVAVVLRDQDWSALAELAGPTAVALLAVAFVINVVALWIGFLSWRALLSGLGSPLPHRSAAGIFAIGVLTKFIPGRVWSLLAMIRLGRPAGVGPARMTGLYLLTTAVTLLTGLAVGAGAAPTLLGGTAYWLLAGIVPLVAVTVRPDLVSRLVTVGARRLRRDPPPPVEPGRVRYAIVTQAVAWLVGGVHLWLLAVAVGAPPTAALPLCLAGYALGWVVSALVVVVPDGLGVREVALATVLATVLPLPQASVVVVASRLVTTVGEVAFSALALLLANRSRPATSGLPRATRPAGGPVASGATDQADATTGGSGAASQTEGRCPASSDR